MTGPFVLRASKPCASAPRPSAWTPFFIPSMACYFQGSAPMSSNMNILFIMRNELHAHWNQIYSTLSPLKYYLLCKSSEYNSQYFFLVYSSVTVEVIVSSQSQRLLPLRGILRGRLILYTGASKSRFTGVIHEAQSSYLYYYLSIFICITTVSQLLLTSAFKCRLLLMSLYRWQRTSFTM